MHRTPLHPTAPSESIRSQLSIMIGTLYFEDQLTHYSHHDEHQIRQHQHHHGHQQGHHQHQDGHQHG